MSRTMAGYVNHKASIRIGTGVYSLNDCACERQQQSNRPNSQSVMNDMLPPLLDPAIGLGGAVVALYLPDHTRPAILSCVDSAACLGRSVHIRFHPTDYRSHRRDIRLARPSSISLRLSCQPPAIKWFERKIQQTSDAPCTS